MNEKKKVYWGCGPLTLVLIIVGVFGLYNGYPISKMWWWLAGGGFGLIVLYSTFKTPVLSGSKKHSLKELEARNKKNIHKEITSMSHRMKLEDNSKIEEYLSKISKQRKVKIVSREKTNSQLEKMILDYVTTLPTELPSYFAGPNELKKYRPYKDLTDLILRDIVCGYRDEYFAVVFKKYCIRYSRLSNNSSAFRDYLDIQQSKTFFTSLKGGMKSEVAEYIHNKLLDIYENWLASVENEEKEKEFEIKNKEQRVQNKKTSLITRFDKDGNGLLDVTESSDFLKLLKKHQSKIKDIDRTYTQRFVQLSNFLKSKAENLQNLFEEIKKTANEEDLDVLSGLLKNQIHTFESLLFHSLNMLVALVNEDDITFFEIYESFDKLNVFDKEWEKQVCQKLDSINSDLRYLMFSINKLEKSISYELGKMNYMQGEYSKNLGQVMSSELKSINSNIKMNSLLTGIQTYKAFQIK